MKIDMFNAGVNRVEFKSGGVKLIGNLFCPRGYSEDREYAAIVVAGPMATVKEQAAGVFASKLSELGFVALAFDYRRFGESEGEPRGYEDPASKGEDLQNAVSFLRTLSKGTSARVGVLGICASSSYAAPVVISDQRISCFATVAAHFSLYEFFAENPMVTALQKEALLKASNEARERYFSTGEAARDDMVWPDMTGDEEGAFFQEIYDYYFARREGCWPNFSNHLVAFSYEQLLKSHALDCAKHIVQPYLGIVGSDAVTRSYTERFISEKRRGEADLEVIEGASHIQSYDRPEYVDEAASILRGFFQEHLTEVG
jgi:hypothetical protein